VRVRYTLPALADLDSVLDYIATRSPQGARNVQARIKAVIELLRSYPYIGSPTRDPSIRRIVTTPYPYVVFYEVAGDDLIIHAVRHGARDPSTMPGSE
jgi:toxin ParE1/3/4